MMSKNISVPSILTLTIVIIGFLVYGISFAQPVTQPTTQTTTTSLNALPSPSDVTRQEAIIKGNEFGTKDGELAARIDFNAGRVSSAPVLVMTDQQIFDKFALNRDSYTFNVEFIRAYRVYYEISYNTTYRGMAYNLTLQIRNDATIQGKAFAVSESFYMASLDLVKNRSNNWVRAYNEFIALGSLEARYRLDRETEEYKESFISAFRVEFQLSYTKAFSNINVMTEAQNVNYHLVGKNEDLIKVDQIYGEVVAGALGTVSNTAANIKIPRGAIYQETYIGLHHVQNSFGHNANEKDPVTHQVRISIANTPGKLKLYKPLEIIFDFDGSERAGIYEWKYNRWIYMPTQKGDGFISAQIPIGDYTGGTYIVLIDNEYTLPADISFHWAFQDIITASKREFLPKSEFFRPNDMMTREEMADVIYRILNYRAASSGRTKNYSDSALVAVANRTAVNYVLDRGIMFLDTKLRFNPKGTISYAEFEGVMKRILFIDFKFQTVSDKLRTERFYRTDYSKGNKLPIKRAEVVYTLSTFIK